MEEKIVLSDLPKTWIFDLDGTIVKHNGYKTDGIDTLLMGVEEFMAKVVQGDMIIFLTSRTDQEKELAHAPFKLLAIDIDDRSRLEAFRREVEASDFAEDITCAFSSARYLEFYNKKAGKGNALRNLCSAVHVHRKNAVAAGDEENDITMIEAAAVGICMASG